MPTRLMFRILKIINKTNNDFLKNSVVRVPYLCQLAHYSSKLKNGLIQCDESVKEEEKKLKTKSLSKITLINGNQTSVTSLEEAQKLSKRRDLKLVKILDLDTKTQRPIYKLMTGSEFHIEDLKQREQKKKDKHKYGMKGEKVLIINQNISQHDLLTNAKKISKWIAKSYEVCIVINGDKENMDKTEQVYNNLETILKPDCRFLSKQQRGTNIKFQVQPLNKQKTDIVENS